MAWTRDGDWIVDPFGNRVWAPDVANQGPSDGPPGYADVATSNRFISSTDEPLAGVYDADEIDNSLLGGREINTPAVHPLAQFRPQLGSTLAPPGQDPLNQAQSPFGPAPVDPVASPMAAPAAPDPAQVQPAAPALLPPMPVGEAQAAQDVNDAFALSAVGKQDALDARFASDKDYADRGVSAMEGQLTAHDQIVADQMARREAANQAAAKETSNWLNAQEAKAREKIDPSHYFESRSGFSKAMWIVALFTGAAAAGADQSKNVALRMLQEQISQDVQLQRERLTRELEVGRLRGQAMDVRHKRQLDLLDDKDAAEWHRWTALGKAAEAKAKVPGQSQFAAANLELADVINQERMRILEGRHANEAKKAAEVLDKAHEAKQNELSRSVQWANIAQSDRHHAIDNQRAYDLAQLSAAASLANGQGGPQSQTALPTKSGFYVEMPDGTRVALPVDEKRYADVAKAAQTAKDSAVAFQNLRKALVGTDGTSRAFATDAEFESAYRAALAPVAKASDPGGKLSDADIERAGIDLLGMDKMTLWGRIKGAGPGEVLALLDQKIAALPGNAEVNVMIAAGYQLPPGHKLRHVPDPTLGWKNPHQPNTQEAIEAAGGKVAPTPRPRNSGEVRKMTKGKIPLPPLPKGTPDAPGPGARVEALTSLAGQDPKQKGHPVSHDKLYGAAAQARQAIVDWEQANQGKLPDANAIANQAIAQINVVLEDAAKKSESAIKRVKKAVADGEISTFDEIKAKATRVGVRLADDEIIDLVNAANKVVKRKFKLPLGTWEVPK